MCSPWNELTRNWESPKPVMCCICLDWKALDELEVDEDGKKWDMCKPCAATERKISQMSPEELEEYRNRWRE